MFNSDVLIGIFVGLLCGLVPLIYGILKKIYIWAIIGTVLTTATGVVFSLLGKSPFTAIVVGVLFILFIIANQKRKEKHSEENEENDHADDL